MTEMRKCQFVMQIFVKNVPTAKRWLIFETINTSIQTPESGNVYVYVKSFLLHLLYEHTLQITDQCINDPCIA